MGIEISRCWTGVGTFPSGRLGGGSVSMELTRCWAWVVTCACCSVCVGIFSCLLLFTVVSETKLCKKKENKLQYVFAVFTFP